MLPSEALARASSRRGATPAVTRSPRSVAELADVADRPARAGHAALQPHAAASRFTAFRQEVLADRLRHALELYGFRPSDARQRQTRCSPTRASRFRCRPRTRYLVPKVGVHVTRYAVDANTQGLTDQTRTLPDRRPPTRASSSSANRDSPGMPFIQTLEPQALTTSTSRSATRAGCRISKAASQDINFATMFTGEPVQRPRPHQRREPGHAGRHSRFIHPDSGIERLRVARRAALLLPGPARHAAGRRAPPGHTRELGHPRRAVRHDPAAAGPPTSAWQYNTDSSQTQKFNVATRYQPAPGRC